MKICVWIYISDQVWKNEKMVCNQWFMSLHFKKKSAKKILLFCSYTLSILSHNLGMKFGYGKGLERFLNFAKDNWWEPRET